MTRSLARRNMSNDGAAKSQRAAAAAHKKPTTAAAQIMMDESKTGHRIFCGKKCTLIPVLLALVVTWCVLNVHTVLLKHDTVTATAVVVPVTNHNGQRVTTARQRSGTSISSGLVSDSSAAQMFPKKENLQLFVPEGFDSILERAFEHADQCKMLQDDFRGFDTRSVLPFHNDTVASLPAFGIVHAIQSYFASAPQQGDWPVCRLPPANECEETQLTVVFMAYNPDRLGITMEQIQKQFDPAIFQNLVKEVILVWNGERHIDESSDGVKLLEYAKDHPVRIVYPLKMGFPNDLMNRYHPDVVQPTTKALLYYDDDGPFYSYQAIQGGFELWKRHPTAQIGAMARQLTYSQRQREQHVQLLGAETAKKARPGDDKFVSHCTNVDDQVDYQFRFFANYDANMVLPSGSMLHANYLCYLWHPAFAEIRKFVLDHPVHPDDMTVSMIVSQLAGVAPRVYSRRLGLQDKKSAVKKPRRLSERVEDMDNEDEEDFDEPVDLGIVPLSELQRRRSLMFSICWDCGSGMTEMKQFWAELRTEAINSLVRYFGSLNSGSIGWCAQDSKYYNAAKDGRCEPDRAKQGWLPWMNPDGTPKDTCP